MSKAKKWLLGIVAAFVIVPAAIYAELIRDMSDDELMFLVGSLDDNPVFSSAASLILRHHRLTPEEARSLNGHHEAWMPVTMLKSDDDAEEWLALFISRGVDINAGDKGNKNRTALHSMAFAGNVARAQLLIRHGARIDARDDQGQTPLELVQAAHAKHPEPARAQMIEFLEAKHKQVP